MRNLRKLNSIGDQNPENYVEPSLALANGQVYTNMEEYPWIFAKYKVNSLPANIVHNGSNISGIYVNGKPYDSTSFDKTGDYKVSIILKNNTYIGPNTFYFCSGLTSIEIPNSVTSIGQWAFEGCNKLTSITIPSSVTSIGGQSFEGCTSLTSITIPSSVTSIEGQAFSNCTGLTSITIPSSVNTIGEKVFQSCTGLSSVNITSGVTSIGTSAFSGCSSLISITIPSSVTSIGAGAFSGCGSLTSIICLATTPPTLTGTNVFSNTNNCPIYVPSGSVDAYKSANRWSSYASRIQAIV